jgi:hypothetical protein
MKFKPKLKPLATQSVGIEGFLTIKDANTHEVLISKKNAINYENMSIAIANVLASRSNGSILRMAFGNGASSVDVTGVISYLPPNATGQNAALYNQTYSKIIDDTSVLNNDPTRNKMSISHLSGKVYTDILIECLLDYGEPAGQMAFDNATQNESSFVFDEIGILANWGVDGAGNEQTKLLTHVIFHPVQKSLNRQIMVEYVIRIQSLTNMVTI